MLDLWRCQSRGHRLLQPSLASNYSDNQGEGKPLPIRGSYYGAQLLRNLDLTEPPL